MAPPERTSDCSSLLIYRSTAVIVLSVHFCQHSKISGLPNVGLVFGERNDMQIFEFVRFHCSWMGQVHPFFHALTGCPMLGIGKKSGWAAWTNFPDVTETVTSLTENQTTWERGGASFPGERGREGLFSTIQQYSCGNCEQQHKVEGCQKGTRPIIVGHPLWQNKNTKPREDFLYV